MTILSLARVFTGKGSESGELKQMAKLKQKKQFVDAGIGGVSPSVIGSCSTTCVEQLDEDEVDDEVENGAVAWRSCSGCAFFLGPHEAKCSVCGTQNPFQNEPESDVHGKIAIVEGASNLGSAVSKQTGDEVAMMKVSQIDVDPQGADDAASDSTDISDDSDLEFESESEGEPIEGTLDIAPPVGTQVKVLYDDDMWHLATVLAASGAKARVRFENGKCATLDFEAHAVRLADYASDDEDEIEQEVAKVEAATPKAQEHEDSDDEEERIPGTLMEAPVVGAVVEILYEDDRWYPARVTAAKGTKASIISVDDEEDEVDFEEHSVRLIDYIGEDVRWLTVLQGEGVPA